MSDPCSMPILVTIVDWCMRYRLTNETLPTPAYVAKGIMEVKMTPYTSKRTYVKRKVIIELVFGWIKQNRGIRTINRRGVVHCQDEWR